MNNDLIERYIYAATKRLPRKTREDVSMELRGLIDDMLTERCGNKTPAEKDIRVVLTELGSPMEMYAKYDADADKCLIGQPYYSTYKFIVKIVLASVVLGVTIVSILGAFIEPAPWHEMISEWIGSMSGSVMASFGIVTILFAFFQDKGIRLDSSSNLDELPSVPKKKQEISKADSVIGIVIEIVFATLFLVAPQVLCAINTETGMAVPIFHVDTLRARWYIIILFTLFGIIRETVKLLEGRYNRIVMLTTVVTNSLSAVTGIWWLYGADLINPVFSAMIQSAGENETLAIALLQNFRGLFLGVMILFLVLDTIEAVVKTLRK